MVSELRRILDDARTVLSIVNERLAPGGKDAESVDVGALGRAVIDPVTRIVTATKTLGQNAEALGARKMLPDLARIAEADKATGGTVIWLNLAWYPMLLLMYAAGISALHGGRYHALRAALLTPVYSEGSRSGQRASPVILPAIDDITRIVDAFKMLPDMERKYVPRSEYIFKKLQPVLEDQLFLGRSYESLFDEFEILLALTYVDLSDDDVTRHVWGPLGRFAWKERGRGSDVQVDSEFVAKAKAQGDQWEPLRAGFFRGSGKRFSDVADAYGQLLAKLNWW
jgi:hypothetical protein